MSLTSSNVAVKIEVFKSLDETCGDLLDDKNYFINSINNDIEPFDVGLQTCFIQNIYKSILEEDENVKLTEELVKEILIALGTVKEDGTNMSYWSEKISYLWM